MLAAQCWSPACPTGLLLRCERSFHGMDEELLRRMTRPGGERLRVLVVAGQEAVRVPAAAAAAVPVPCACRVDRGGPHGLAPAGRRGVTARPGRCRRPRACRSGACPRSWRCRRTQRRRNEPHRATACPSLRGSEPPA